MWLLHHLLIFRCQISLPSFYTYCDRRTRRRCDYGMYVSLAIYTRARQDISKRDRYIGHVDGWTEGGIDKRQKAVVAYSAWGCTCAGHLSLFLPLAFSFSLLFFHSIVITQLRVCYCSFSFLFCSSSAHPNSYIVALVLHSFFAFLSFSNFILL